MSRIISFEYKGQAINYYNKVNANKRVVSASCYLGEGGKYYVSYTMK